jgi:peptidyl-prolyl cis-trans isomerase C
MVKKVLLIILILCGLCVGCQTIEQVPNATLTPTEKPPTVSPSPTPTPFQPSPTPIPLAARVNGDVITLSEFDSELARYRSAQPGIVFKPGQAEKAVLDDLIDQILLIQQARLAGFELNDIQLKTHLDQLIQDSGGAESFNKWLVTNGYSLETFKDSLWRSSCTAWMRDRIIASVPLVAEQVHARQILFFYADQANQVLNQLQAGKDFATIALRYDPVAGGDLGWFPRGYLTELKLEEAAFSLQPEEFSLVIQTRLGYHILQVLERQVDRPLEPDALRSLQVKALGDWLIIQREKSEIVIIIDLPK